MAFRVVPKGRGARLLLATAAASFAATGVANASCPARDVSQPFSQFGDSAFYTLLPDGGFESGAAGWSLNGNSVASGNEKYFAHAAGDALSLQVKANTSVVSPSFCVDQDMPSLRLFAKKLDKSKGSVRVEVLYTGTAGTQKVAPAGNVANSGRQDFSDWTPSGLLKLSSVLPMSKGGTASVQLRLTADSGGDWVVDDVYADPRLRR